MLVDDLEASAHWFESERKHARIAVAAQKVAEKEVILVAIRKSEAGIEDEAGWPTRNMVERRKRPSGLQRRELGGLVRREVRTQMPNAFLIPRPALICALKRLVVHRPTSLAALHAINEACFVATV